jgi:predicted secreted protein with PEFG-CTERM motif
MEVDVTIATDSNIQGCEETDECYIPHEVTIDPGGEVTWTNEGVSATTVTSGSPQTGPDGIFDSGLIQPGNSFSFKFEEEGTFHYFSMIHPWMQGTIIVEAEHEHEEEHEDMEMMGIPSATGMSKDGEVVVKIWTTKPTAGERLEITMAVVDDHGHEIEHVNHDIRVTQNGKEVLHDEGAHHHEGTGTHMTAPLTSNDPIDIEFTLRGFGMEEPFEGPIGEKIVFTNVVLEFGTITVIVLAISLISIIVFSAKSKTILKV